MTVSIPCQQITDNTSCILPCLTQKLTNHRQQILSCLAQIPPNHRQQIVHLAMPHTDANKPQATIRSSCHASYRYQRIERKRKSSRGYDLLRALGPASCDITHETGDTSCDITHEPRARFVAMLTACWTTKKQHVCDSFLTLKTLQLSKQDELVLHVISHMR